ncbi:hypothetical protein Pint_04781 [Pistacia integerrima]|uniref:Uncharacterized protein n=1 Tax=Pistacia integerrima TaxID=434235 RepID=A0ACC0Z7K9_9ROSI|nr:hypothetical protein Pint_04781 [Pistacia integerrima]
MASPSKTALVFVLVITIFYIPSLEGRKVLSLEKIKVPTLEDNLVLSALAKGTTTPPCGKFDNKLATNGRLITKDISQDDEGDLDSSVPSPGIGNYP